MSKEGREQYRRDVARAARTPRSRGGTGAETLPGGTGASGRTAKGEKVVYYYNPKTGKATYWVGSGKPPGSGWQSIGGTKPKGWIGGQARGVATDIDKEIGISRIKEIQATGKYYYDPVTKVATTRSVEGQTGMTKSEVLTVIRHMPRKTKVEYKQAYQEYLESKKPTPRVEPRVRIEPRAEVPSLAEGIRFGRPPPTIPLAPVRKPGPQETVLPSYAGLPIYGIRPPKLDVSKEIQKGTFVIPTRVTPKETISIPIEYKPPYKFDITKVTPIDIKKIKAVDIGVDITKVAKYRKEKVTWESRREIEKALEESNVQLFKQMSRGQTKSMKQLSDIRIGEQVERNITEFYAKEQAKVAATFAGTMIGVGALGQAIPAVAAAKVPIVSQMARFSISPAGSKVITGMWGVSLGYRGYKQKEYFEQGDFERGMYGLSMLGAEVAGVYGAGKWLTATEGKPITKLYRQAYTKFKTPSFERSIAKWQKEITAKDWAYMEKRGFLPIKGKPQRTLFGEPISPKEIRIARKAAGLDTGYFGMEVRYRPSYDRTFVQTHLKDMSKIGIDFRYKPPKRIKLTSVKDMELKGYSKLYGYESIFGKKPEGILGLQPEKFIFKQEPIKTSSWEKLQARVIPGYKTTQTLLVKPTQKVTKYDRPFYLKKPKLPKPVKLGKPTPTTPTIKAITKPSKPSKTMGDIIGGTMDVSPVVVSVPKPAPAEVIGTIPGGTRLAGALVFGGFRSMRDWTKSFSRQFGDAGQRARQGAIARQSTKFSQALDKAAREITKAPTEQIPKVAPKLKPKVKTLPKLKQPTRQIPKMRQPVPTKPLYPYPSYPIHKEPEPPIIPLKPKLPLLKWPRGMFYPKAKKIKKVKPFHKYMPSLVAGFKKITAPKIPKIITGLGIRPVVRRRL